MLLLKLRDIAINGKFQDGWPPENPEKQANTTLSNLHADIYGSHEGYVSI